MSSHSSENFVYYNSERFQSDDQRIVSVHLKHYHLAKKYTMFEFLRVKRRKLKNHRKLNLKKVFDNIQEENPRYLTPDCKLVRSSLYRIRTKTHLFNLQFTINKFYMFLVHSLITSPHPFFLQMDI